MSLRRAWTRWGWIGAILLLGVSGAWGAPANPFPVEVSQPDGTRILLVDRGDEFLHWTETPEGVSVVRNPRTGFWEYALAETRGMDLLPSAVPVDPRVPPPRDLRPRQRPWRLQGVPVSREAVPVEVRQPDGTVLRLLRRGGGDLVWLETPEGYGVVRDSRTGGWMYGVLHPRVVLVPSGRVVRPGEVPPGSWPRHLKPSPETD